MPRFFEDFTTGEITRSESRTITRDDVHRFADLTGDRTDIHLDEQAAADSRFGRCIAHGALVFAVSIGLIQSQDAEKPYVIAFLGVDKLRFAAPVYLGDTVHVRQAVRSLDVVSADAGLLEVASEVVNETGGVAATYIAKFLVRRAQQRS